MRITPENITNISNNIRVLVGTNESGLHGGGIARYAEENWGLQYKVGFGPSGLCFGLPTKDWKIKTLPLNIINNYVERYINWCQVTDYQHFVTKIGCGLAGYTIPEIAPMFKSCIEYENMWLPQDFLDFYKGIYISPKKQIENEPDTAIQFFSNI